MNSAIYNERGLKVAGGEVMPQALPDQVFLQEMPCYAGGVLYFEQDNGFVGRGNGRECGASGNRP